MGSADAGRARERMTVETAARMSTMVSTPIRNADGRAACAMRLDFAAGMGAR